MVKWAAEIEGQGKDPQFINVQESRVSPEEGAGQSSDLDSLRLSLQSPIHYRHQPQCHLETDHIPETHILRCHLPNQSWWMGTKPGTLMVWVVPGNGNPQPSTIAQSSNPGTPASDLISHM